MKDYNLINYEDYGLKRRNKSQGKGECLKQPMPWLFCLYLKYSFFYTEKHSERKGNNIKTNVQAAAYFFIWDKIWKKKYFKSKINLKLHVLAKIYQLTKWMIPLFLIKLLNPMYSYFSGTGTALIWGSSLTQQMYCCSKV